MLWWNKLLQRSTVPRPFAQSLAAVAVVVAFETVTVFTTSAYGEAAAFDISPLKKEFAATVENYYPDVRISGRDAERFEFAANSRTFMIHLRDKSGKWQEPVAVRGPDHHGIVGTVSIHHGRWRGAALLPQTMSRFYFSEYVNAYYAESSNTHIFVSVRYPEPYPSEFIGELESLLSRFDQTSLLMQSP